MLHRPSRTSPGRPGPVRRLRRPLAAFVAAAALLAACGRGPSPAVSGPRAPAAASAILNVDWGGEPASLNPLLAADAISYNVLDQVMEGLVRLNRAGTPVPGIASSWTVGPRARTYTFSLRPARWSNGDALTAADFVFAWDAALNPCTGSPTAGNLSAIEGAAALLALRCPDPHAHPAAFARAQRQATALDAHLGLRALSTHTLRVTLSLPSPYWLDLTALPVYFPADAARVRAWGVKAYGTAIDRLVFDGPFVISKWRSGDYLDLRRNPRYWDAAAVHLAGVHGLMVSDPATAVNLYQAGQLDILAPVLPSSYVHRFRGRPGFRSATAPTTWFLWVNTAVAPLTNVHVRRALSAAIDRRSLAGAVVRGGAHAAYALTPPGIVAAPAPGSFASRVGPVLPVTAHPSRARAELGTGLRQLHLTQLPPLTVLGPASARSELATLQAFWRQNLGVGVRVQTVDMQAELADLQSGRFDLALIDWSYDYNDPTSFLNVFAGPMDFTHWADPAYTGALQRAAAAGDSPARAADLATAERALLSQLPAIPLFWPGQNWVAHADIHGLVVHPLGETFSLRGVVKA